MKKLIFLVLAILFMAAPAEAQLLRSRTFAETVKPKKDFNRISLGYDATFLSEDFGTMNGVNLEYIHGFRLSSAPLFLELGLDVAFNIKSFPYQYLGTKWYDDSYHYFIGTSDYDEKLISLSVRVPINLSYRINLSDKVSFQPFTGLNFKINPFLSDVCSQYVDSYSDGYIETYEDFENKIFQFGWQIGFGFNFSKVYLGVQYGLDFLPRASCYRETCYCQNYYYYDPYYGGSYYPDYYYESDFIDIKTSHLTVNLGINF